MSKVRIIKAPAMEYGGRLPYAGRNANSVNRVNPIANQMVDTRWRYFSPADVYSYKKDDYATKRNLPESEDPDIIVEKQEQIIGDFNGDGKQELMGVNTGTHDSGDDQGVNVPDGSFVFSDTKELTIDLPYGIMSNGADTDGYSESKDGKKAAKKGMLYGYKDFGATGPATPAKLAKKYDLQKMSAIIDDPKKDQLEKNTAQLMYENYINKLTQLADTQESMKAVKKAKQGDVEPEIEMDQLVTDEMAQQEMEQMGEMRNGGYAYKMQGGGGKPRVSSSNMAPAPRVPLKSYTPIVPVIPFQIGEREKAEAERIAAMEATDAQRRANMRYVVGTDPYSLSTPPLSRTVVADPLRAYGILPPGYTGNPSSTTPVSATSDDDTDSTTTTTSSSSASTGTGKKRVRVTAGPSTSETSTSNIPKDEMNYLTPAALKTVGVSWNDAAKGTGIYEQVGTSFQHVPGSDYHPQEVDMSALGAYEPVIPRGSTRFNKFLVGARDAAKVVGKTLSNPDLLGDVALAAKAAGIKKYKPWEPPVVSVMPQASYLSPERELAYNAEMAAMAGYTGDQIGNTRVAGAIRRGAQGQALTNAANILGKTYNANIGIKNQFETLANNLTNETLEKQRERAGRLNYDTFMANQMYRNQINDVMDATVKRAYQKENEDRNREVANLNNKYWHYDKRGFPVWNYEGAREKYLQEMEDVEKGYGKLPTGTTVSSVADRLMAMGFTDRDEAIAEAKNYIKHHMGIPVTQEKITTDATGKTKTEKSTVKKAKKGGFSPKSISKFLAHSLG